MEPTAEESRLLDESDDDMDRQQLASTCNDELDLLLLGDEEWEHRDVESSSSPRVADSKGKTEKKKEEEEEEEEEVVVKRKIIRLDAPSRFRHLPPLSQVMKTPASPHGKCFHTSPHKSGLSHRYSSPTLMLKAPRPPPPPLTGRPIPTVINSSSLSHSSNSSCFHQSASSTGFFLGCLEGQRTGFSLPHLHRDGSASLGHVHMQRQRQVLPVTHHVYQPQIARRGSAFSLSHLK